MSKLKKFTGLPMFHGETNGLTFPLTHPFVREFSGLSDAPSLDLQFAADKTLTARKGPTPTFLRASGATQVNAAGLIEYAPENLSLQSETIGTTWTQTNASVASNVAIAPDGNTTADKIVENTANAFHGIEQQTIFIAATYTFSFYAKKDERAWIRAFLAGSGSTWFNVDNGTVGTVAPGVTALIVDAGNGWYRCSITATAAAGTSQSGVRPAPNDGTLTYLGDGTSGILFWGAQLERSSTARAYIPTTTAAVYAPRFDHDPVTLACKGLLIEEQRVNSALYSGLLVVGTGWSANATPSVTSVVDGLGPDGNNAYEVAEIANTGSHTLFNTGGAGTTGATSVVSGTTYTGSIFIKKVVGSIDWIQLSFSAAGFGSVQYANFNISNGTIGNFSSSSPRIQDAGNGWYRCSISVVATTTTTTSSNLFLTFTDNTDTTTRLPSYAGNTANKVLAAMCQFEAGAFPTSYIPTTTGPVTRSADTCSITGSAFSGFYNQPEGTFLADAIPQTVSQAAAVVAVNTTTFNNSHIIYKIDSLPPSAGRKWAGVTFETAAVAAIFTSTDVAITRSKLAYGYKLNDIAFAASGLLIGTDTSATMPSPTSMHIGMRDSSFQLNGHIASLRYFKKRLPNAKLQTLTT